MSKQTHSERTAKFPIKVVTSYGAFEVYASFFDDPNDANDPGWGTVYRCRAITRKFTKPSSVRTTKVDGLLCYYVPCEQTFDCDFNDGMFVVGERELGELCEDKSAFEKCKRYLRCHEG